MRRSCWLLALSLAACYKPTPPAGSPCGSSPCPAPLVCSPASQTCEAVAVDAAAGRDAPVLGDALPPGDGPITVDAPLDAATVVDGPPPMIDAPLAIDAPPDAPWSRYQAAVMADHPIGYFRLGDGAGATTLRDEISPARPASIVSGIVLGQPGALAGDPDTAAIFDGVACSATLPAGTFGFVANAAFSVEGWLLVGLTTAATPGYLLRVGVSGSSGYGLSWNGTGFTLVGYGTTGRVEVVSPPITPGAYHHVVATYDGATGVVYVDGVSTVALAVDIGDSTGGAATTIGNGTGGGSPLGGTLDELAVYDRALTAAEVVAHFQAGGP
jgi:hypothetical protein